MLISRFVWILSVGSVVALAAANCWGQDAGVTIPGLPAAMIPGFPAGLFNPGAGNFDPAGAANLPPGALAQPPGGGAQLQNQQLGNPNLALWNLFNGIPGGMPQAWRPPTGVVNGRFVGGAWGPAVFFYDAGDGSVNRQPTLTPQEMRALARENSERKRMVRLTSLRARAVADREAMEARKAKRAAAAAR
jgi:hypothetical protein